MNLIDEQARDFEEDMPDGVGWVRAARAWHLSLRTGRLTSLVASADWRPGETMEMTCLVAYLRAQHPSGGAAAPVISVKQWTPAPCERCPGDNCKCGAWGLKNPAFFQEAGNYLFNDCIFGIVELSGRIIEGKLGYRAQKARVAGIVLKEPTNLGSRFTDDLIGVKKEAVYTKLKTLAEMYKVPLYGRWPVEADGSVMQHDPVGEFWKDVSDGRHYEA